MVSTQALISSTSPTRTPANEPLSVQQQQQTDIKESLYQLPIQRKLSVGAADDPLEKEADDMADKVMRMPNPGPISFSTSKNVINRKCSECEKEEELQRKESNGETVSAAPSIVQNVLSSPGKSLDTDTRSFMEPRFNYDFSDVKIHANDLAAKSASSINALAYTSGNNVVFNSGQYNTSSDSGKRLLVHELTHVMQQSNNLQRKSDKEEECAYEKKEVDISHSSAGHLANDVVELGNGKILIADFGVDWRHVNSNIQDDPVFKKWDEIFSSDDSYQVSIIGYSDCAGSEKNNTRLRHSRAKNVKDILSSTAKSRIVFTGMAALGDYIVNNDSTVNRAMNRGVIIEFSQKMDFEAIDVEGDVKRCGPDSTDWLRIEMTDNSKNRFVKDCADADLEKVIPGWGWGVQAACLEGFKDLVKAGAIWDFKSNQKQWRSRSGHYCPSEACDKTVTLCGHCLNYDVPGNIHYGWIGRMMEYRPWVLHKGAAMAQKGGVDDPRDTVAIDIGINMADKGVDLCDEINSKLSQLNLDGTEKCMPCPWDNLSPKDRKSK